MEERLAKIEKDLELIKKRLRKTAKERELKLQEKFQIHDRAQGFLRQFDEIVGGLPHENVWFSWFLGSTYDRSIEQRKASIKELKEIVYNLAKLVDNALGVQF